VLAQPDSFQVIITNAAKHHAFQTARAAAEAGVLKQFITGLHYKPAQWPYTWLHGATAKLAPGFAKRLTDRRDEELDAYSRSLPGLGVFQQLALNVPPLRGTRLSITADLLFADWFDRLVAKSHLEPCDIFHGFESCALHSFMRAKELGATLVLEQPVMHIDALRKLASEEYVRLGIPIPKEPLLYSQAIARKYRELDLADHILVGLRFVKDTLVAHGVPEAKIIVVPYGVETHGFFQPVERPRRDTFTILYVGALTWYKGLPQLLDVYRRLRLPKKKLLIVGREHPNWGKYFRERFAELDDVEWIPGVPQRDLANIYARADVFVFPSLVGGVGLVVYEAMSTGLPVIVSDGDVIIRDGIDGLVAASTEPYALESALLRLHEDHELRRCLGENAVKRANDFSWANYRHKVIKAYQTILMNRQ
jgi:glycosyltransferase involved in cell wall biosynthesis